MWTAPLLVVLASPAPPVATIDHVIIATPDLEQGMAELERLTGVRPAVGGAHPGRGTRNALMSLGQGAYLELIAPDPAQPADVPEAKRLRTLAALTPDGWAVSPTDGTALRASYAAGRISLTPPVPGSRLRPDGVRLSWQTFGFRDEDRWTAPFFITWGDMRLHPSAAAPGGCTLAGLLVRDPAPARLDLLLRPVGLPVPVIAGPAPAMEVRLRCPTGEVVLR